VTGSGVTSGGSQSHSKGGKVGVRKHPAKRGQERGTDSLPLDAGQTLSPIIKHSTATRN